MKINIFFKVNKVNKQITKIKIDYKCCLSKEINYNITL